MAVPIGIAALFGGLSLLRQSPIRRRRLLLAAVFALGVARGACPSGSFPPWLLLRAQGIEEVSGTVTSYPSLGDGYVSFTLQPDHLPAAIRVTWFPSEDALQRVYVGDRVVVRGSVRLPESFDGFDYPAYLARRWIFATLFADGDGALERTGASGSTWLRAGDRLRQSILARLESVLGDEAVALAQGLLFGDRTALTDDVEEAFRRTGLMHVLAVSGLHLGILLAAAWLLLRRIGVRPAVAYPVVAILVAVFLWIVGPRVSLLRAALLFAFVGAGSVLADLGLVLRRTVRPLNGLAAAGLVLLGIHPADLFDVGFQLSFAATTGILFAVAPGVREGWAAWVTRVAKRGGLLNPVLRSALNTLVVSVAAQAAVTPILAWHFGGFHPLLVGLNLLVIPLVTMALWVGFPTALLAAAGAPGLLAIPFEGALRALSGLVGAFSRLPWVELPVAPWFGLWAAAMVLFLVVTWRYASGSSWTWYSTSIVFGSDRPPDGAAGS